MSYLYDCRELIKNEKDEDYFLKKMLDHATAEKKEEEGGRKPGRYVARSHHRVEMYITSILISHCQANLENFKKVNEILAEKGFEKDKIEKFI